MIPNDENFFEVVKPGVILWCKAPIKMLSRTTFFGQPANEVGSIKVGTYLVVTEMTHDNDRYSEQNISHASNKLIDFEFLNSADGRVYRKYFVNSDDLAEKFSSWFEVIEP